MNNLILGCANSLIAHQVYADFLEDSGKDTRFFRIFLQMRRQMQAVVCSDGSGQGISFSFKENCYDEGFGDGVDCGWGCGCDGEFDGNGKISTAEECSLYL